MKNNAKLITNECSVAGHWFGAHDAVSQVDQIFADLSTGFGVFHVCTYVVPYVSNKNRIPRINFLSDRFFLLI